MNTDPLLEHLRKRLPDLLAVYLFGSHATGTAAAGSDVDLAVLVPGQVEPLRLFEIAGELASRRTPECAGCLRVAGQRGMDRGVPGGGLEEHGGLPEHCSA